MGARHVSLGARSQGPTHMTAKGLAFEPCQMCADPYGLRFSLVRNAITAKGRTSRGAGGVTLCQSCWRDCQTPIRRGQPRDRVRRWNA
jgi:hypothetical protein